MTTSSNTMKQAIRKRRAGVVGEFESNFAKGLDISEFDNSHTNHHTNNDHHVSATTDVPTNTSSSLSSALAASSSLSSSSSYSLPSPSSSLPSSSVSNAAKLLQIKQIERTKMEQNDIQEQQLQSIIQQRNNQLLLLQSSSERNNSSVLQLSPPSSTFTASCSSSPVTQHVHDSRNGVNTQIMQNYNVVLQLHQNDTRCTKDMPRKMLQLQNKKHKRNAPVIIKKVQQQKKRRK